MNGLGFRGSGLEIIGLQCLRHRVVCRVWGLTRGSGLAAIVFRERGCKRVGLKVFRGKGRPGFEGVRNVSREGFRATCL